MDLLPFTPLDSQRGVLMAASYFAAGHGQQNGVFLLNGYAGTGKTSLLGALIRALSSLHRPVCILAPTGRAAKVASSFSGHKASTIHRRIFRPDLSDPSGRTWIPSPNETRDTLFIVDESSLIGDLPGRSLLELLVRYVYSAPGCRMMLIGDEAQLPPVGQTEATAMSPERLKALGLHPYCRTLDIPVRQASGSGIVHNATIVRLCLANPPEDMVPCLDVAGMPDIGVLSSADLADSLADSFASVGQEETLIITRSNFRANDFNKAVRNMVMYAEQPLERGDKLVISKNDYYWAPRNKCGSLIANGDTAEVTWVGRTEKQYGRFFTDVELRLSDSSVVNVLVMLRSLAAEGPSIQRSEMERFANIVMSNYEGEYSEKLKALDKDPYYNAIQAKYAYCVTCHKAQGGQWKHVYIDMGGIAPDSMGPEFYRWLYTALTRATERVFLINPTVRFKQQPEE